MNSKYYIKKFNDGWQFSRYDEDCEPEEPRSVFIPHDMMINDSRNLYKNCCGCYEKKFGWTVKPDEIVYLRFDGVYQEAEIWLNGILIKEWKYGYSAFDAYLSGALQNGENTLKVYATHKTPNSRWYSGAGIYRDVYLCVRPENRIMPDGVYISSRKEAAGWRLHVETELEADRALEISHTAYNKRSGEVIWKYKGGASNGIHTAETVTEAPELWDITNPVLYELKTTLYENGKETETVYNTFGFRTVEFSAEKGFFLNGRHLKINGVCEHHDLGALGSAFNADAMKRRLGLLREMGVNAIRTAHNMPAKKFMELADEEGFLVLSEAFDMWELPKNKYDYSRFFNEWYKEDVASWIRRDRNCPSVIMWSIGNEIYDTHASERGLEITEKLKAEAEKHDPYRNARVTLASNYMAWENAQKCADAVTLAGYNYGASLYNEHHKNNPGRIIYGSETSSTVQSRGVYHFPLSQPLLADEDEQCSSLGNSSTSWGAKSSEDCIISERDAEYSMGQFLWSGFDYIGEPTPYHTKNSYFGQLDTAGFRKDSYYIYKSAWTDHKKSPMVHIFPYWDFNEGQTIDVRVCTNAPEAELFKDGKSLGRKTIDHINGKKLIADYSIKYSPGKLRALAYDETGRIIAEDTVSSFGDAEKLIMTADRAELPADGESLVFIEINALDKDGNRVENANSLIDIEVSGAGALVGLDNGDSTDYSSYKSSSRRLFNGRLLVIAQTSVFPGELTVTAKSEGLIDARLTLKTVPAEVIPGTADIMTDECEGDPEQNRSAAARKIELTDNRSGSIITADCKSFEISAVCLPHGSMEQELIWQAVTDSGVESNIASVEPHDRKAVVTVSGDGRFRIRCMAKNGYDKIKVISELDYISEGFGEPHINPYKFVSGGLYSVSNGHVSNGNEKGIATARECETVVGFAGVDFGGDYAAEVEIPIFALSSEEYSIRIWDGSPENGGILLCDGIYCKPSIWNTYQSEIFRLDRRLTGIHDIYFTTEAKMHIKGFTFRRINRAYEKLNAAECGGIYGDSFRVDGTAVRNIGNNVVLDFNGLNFEQGIKSIIICGKSHIAGNTIHIRLRDETGETKIAAEFTDSDTIREYRLDCEPGIKNLSIIFMPGSSFDLEWIKCIKLYS